MSEPPKTEPQPQQTSEEPTQAQEPQQLIYNVGVHDASAKRFHALDINGGVSYNSYLVRVGTSFTLIDTVPE